jgi:hypothetical protein
MDVGTIYLSDRLLADQNEKLRTSDMGDSWSAIGYSPYGFGTHRRAQHISFNFQNPHCWSLDVKKMEANHRAWIQRWLAEARFKCLRVEDRTPDNYARIKALYYNLEQCPFIMPDGQLFLKGAFGAGGEPSGHLCTASDNHWVLMLMLAVGYVDWMLGGRELPDYWYFFKHVRAIICGDDANVAVDDELWEFWPTFPEDIARSVYTILGTIIESNSWKTIPWYDLDFCGMLFHTMTDPVNHLTFKYDFDKMLSSLLQGGQTREPAEQLTRIGSYQLLTWGHEPSRIKLQAIRDDYFLQYNTSMHGNQDW